jgi:hypothetical protein
MALLILALSSPHTNHLLKACNDGGAVPGLVRVAKSEREIMIAKARCRSPEEILQAMDKEGVRTDTNLLTQLNAELSVSLAKEADRVSRRNLKVATIACVVAVIALLISLIQAVSGCN